MIRTTLLKIRVILWSVLFLVVIFFLYKGLVPTGRLSFYHNFIDRGVYVDKLDPQDRFIIKNGEVGITGNPIYFNLRTVRDFKKLDFTLIYKNKDFPLVEAGILMDGKNWNYQLKPLENKIIDQLINYSDWNIIRDNNITVGQLILQMASEWFGDAWIDKSGKLVTIVDIGTIVEQEIKGTIFQSDLVETSIILTQRLDDVVNNLLMKYKYDFTNQRYLGNKDGNEDPTYKDINSINAYGNVPQRTLMFRWVKDDAHISKIKDVIFTIYAGIPRPYTKLGFRLKDLRHNNIYAGPFVRFSYNKFYKDGVPMENEVVRIKNISKDFNRMIIDITAEDMEVVSNV